MADWLPLASFFATEIDGPCVLLLVGGKEVRAYFDPDERAWYREGEGPDLESAPLDPEGWRELPGSRAQGFVDNLNRQTRSE